tara:strand:+ start:71 stop:661 length:591 start_codon:yes stop_codon:yes gene_type:complete
MSYNNTQQTNLFEDDPGPPTPDDDNYDWAARRVMGVIQSSNGQIMIDLPNLRITNVNTGQVKPIQVYYNKSGTIASASYTHYYPFDDGTIVQIHPVIVKGQVQQGQAKLVFNEGNEPVPLVTGWTPAEPPDVKDVTAWVWGALAIGSILKGGGSVEDIDTGELDNSVDDIIIDEVDIIHGGGGDGGGFVQAPVQDP